VNKGHVYVRMIGGIICGNSKRQIGATGAPLHRKNLSLLPQLEEAGRAVNVKKHNVVETRDLISLYESVLRRYT
jgi:hypothetical protein